METFDDYYYFDSKGINNPAYDWEHFILTAGMESGQLDLTKDSLNEEETRNYRRFVHEYIHYLQNFTTTWGCFSASSFFSSYLRIGISSLEKPLEKILLPMTLGEYDFKSDYLLAGLKDRFRQIRQLETSDSVSLDPKGDLKKIESRFENKKIVIDNGIVQRTIGLKCIREQMAFLGEMQFLGYSDEQISNFINSNNGFLYENQRLGRQSEYWIIFEYYYQNFKNILEIGVGLFCLMNECLTRLNPDITFYKFELFLAKQKHNLKSGVKFVEILDDWITTQQEVLNYRKSCHYTIKDVEKLYEITKKYTNNDLVISIKELCNIMLQNLKISEGGRRTYFDKFSDFKFPLYWHDMIIKYGTPIVVFNDQVKIFGSPNYTSKAMDCFLRVNAATMVLKKLHDGGKEFMCPYFLDVNICTHPLKSQNVCGKNALQILHQVKNDNHCQLSSGIVLLGLKDRLL